MGKLHGNYSLTSSRRRLWQLAGRLAAPGCRIRVSWVSLAAVAGAGSAPRIPDASAHPPVGGDTDIGDRCEQGVPPEVVGLTPSDLLEQVGLDSAAECRSCGDSGRCRPVRGLVGIRGGGGASVRRRRAPARPAEEAFFVLDGELDLLAFEPRDQACGGWRGTSPASRGESASRRTAASHPRHDDDGCVRASHWWSAPVVPPGGFAGVPAPLASWRARCACQGAAQPPSILSTKLVMKAASACSRAIR